MFERRNESASDERDERDERNARDDRDERARQVSEQAAQASALLAARTRARRDASASSGDVVEGRFDGRGAEPQPSGRPGVDRPGEPLDEPGGQESYPKGIVEFARRNAVYIVGVVAVVVAVTILVIVAGAVMTGCAPASGGGKATASASRYVSSFDWSKVDRSGGRYRYIDNGVVKSRLGIDVSENQHDIDWKAVAADDIDFVMVRVGYRGATEGDLYLDEGYWANLDGARAAGLDCGVYFFSQANTVDEAVEEADFVLTYLNGTPLEYPVAFDSEMVRLSAGQSRTAGLTDDQMTTIAQAFCNRIRQAGYDSMIYGNVHDMARYNYGSIESYPIWWAEYDDGDPDNNLDIVMWQYATTARWPAFPLLST